MNEFGIIEKFFKKKQNNLSNELFNPNIMVGIGDDAAILKLSKNFPIVISTDILVSGSPFFSNSRSKVNRIQKFSCKFI